MADMIRIAGDDIRLASLDDGVVLRLPVNGIQRDFLFSDADAMRLATNLAANAALPSEPTGLGIDKIISIRLKAYDRGGTAHLLLDIPGYGPAEFQIDAKQLEALSKAASAALEHSENTGKA